MCPGTFCTCRGTFCICPPTFCMCRDTFKRWRGTFCICRSTFCICRGTFYMCHCHLCRCRVLFSNAYKTYYICPGRFYMCRGDLTLGWSKNAALVCEVPNTRGYRRSIGAERPIRFSISINQSKAIIFYDYIKLHRPICLWYLIYVCNSRPG